jgi:hypothetical protein
MQEILFKLPEDVSIRMKGGDRSGSDIIAVNFIKLMVNHVKRKSDNLYPAELQRRDLFEIS